MIVVRQLSVFVENKLGRLYEITDILTENNIDIRAITLADTVEFGILRLIVSDPDRAEAALRARDFAVSITKVLGVKVADAPGGLRDVIGRLRENGVSVEYVYAYVSHSKDASVILHVEDIARAEAVLAEAGVGLLNEAY